MNEQLLLSLSDASKMLSVSEKTVRRCIARGDLPVVEIGRRKCIEIQAIHHFIDQNRKYNDQGVELVSSLTGEKTCNSISGVMSTRSPSNMEDAKLDDLLKPVVKR